jgi:hypothetical protein
MIGSRRRHNALGTFIDTLFTRCHCACVLGACSQPAGATIGSSLVLHPRSPPSPTVHEDGFGVREFPYPRAPPHTPHTRSHSPHTPHASHTPQLPPPASAMHESMAGDLPDTTMQEGALGSTPASTSERSPTRERPPAIKPATPPFFAQIGTMSSTTSSPCFGRLGAASSTRGSPCPHRGLPPSTFSPGATVEPTTVGAAILKKPQRTGCVPVRVAIGSTQTATALDSQQRSDRYATSVASQETQQLDPWRLSPPNEFAHMQPTRRGAEHTTRDALGATTPVPQEGRHYSPPPLHSLPTAYVGAAAGASKAGAFSLHLEEARWTVGGAAVASWPFEQALPYDTAVASRDAEAAARAEAVRAARSVAHKGHTMYGPWRYPSLRSPGTQALSGAAVRVSAIAGPDAPSFHHPRGAVLIIPSYSRPPSMPPSEPSVGLASAGFVPSSPPAVLTALDPLKPPTPLVGSDLGAAPRDVHDELRRQEERLELQMSSHAQQHHEHHHEHEPSSPVATVMRRDRRRREERHEVHVGVHDEWHEPHTAVADRALGAQARLATHAAHHSVASAATYANSPRLYVSPRVAAHSSPTWSARCGSRTKTQRPGPWRYPTRSEQYQASFGVVSPSRSPHESQEGQLRPWRE